MVEFTNILFVQNLDHSFNHSFMLCYSRDQIQLKSALEFCSVIKKIIS